jgi:hypothetical protein
MVKRIIVVLIFLCCAVSGPGSNAQNEAQKKGTPDLSGTWKLDRSKGNYARYSGLKPDADLLLIISQAGPEIKVTRKSLWRGQERVLEATYYGDGRGEVASTFLGSSENKSQSSWEGNKFVTRFSVTSETRVRGRITYEVTQEWKLSADGKTLTQTETIKPASLTSMARPVLGPISEGGVFVFPGEIKRVFNRTP